MIRFTSYLVFSLLVSSLIASDYRFDVSEKEFFLNSQFYKLTNEFKIKAKQNNSSNYYSVGNKVKNAAYSLLIPGLGQYKNGNNTRAYLYMGLEIFGWASYFSYGKKFDEEKSSYQNYASYDSENWRFDNWIINHNEDEIDENWAHIWQDEEGYWMDIGCKG